jgi:hypothetical protein
MRIGTLGFELTTRHSTCSVTLSNEPSVGKFTRSMLAVKLEPPRARSLSEITIIDAVRAQVVGTLSLDGHPEFAQTDG